MPGPFAVDDFVVRESLTVPPDSTGLHNPLNWRGFRSGRKRTNPRNGGICLLSRGSQVRVLPGAPTFARARSHASYGWQAIERAEVRAVRNERRRAGRASLRSPSGELRLASQLLVRRSAKREGGWLAGHPSAPLLATFRAFAALEGKSREIFLWASNRSLVTVQAIFRGCLFAQSDSISSGETRLSGI